MAPPETLAFDLLEHGALGPRQGFLAATPVKGAKLYTFTLVPAGGGANVRVTSTRASTAVMGLKEGTTYSVTVTASVPGNQSLTSAPKVLNTPSMRWVCSVQRQSVKYLLAEAVPLAIPGLPHAVNVHNAGLTPATVCFVQCALAGHSGAGFCNHSYGVCHPTQLGRALGFLCVHDQANGSRGREDRRDRMHIPHLQCLWAQGEHSIHCQRCS